MTLSSNQITMPTMIGNQQAQTITIPANNGGMQNVFMVNDYFRLVSELRFSDYVVLFL
jgi:hypothetical protein